MTLTAITTGGGRLKVHLCDGAGETLYDSGMLGNGNSIRFNWPGAT